MPMELARIYQHMGLFALLIAGTLIVFALASLTVFLERLFTFWRSRRSSRRFAAEAGPLIDSGEYRKLLEIAGKYGASHLARLIEAGARTLIETQRKQARLGAVEMTRRELERAAERIESEVRRGLSVLATVGSVAPFVGLLGTVVGIIDAFQGIAREGSGGLGSVSAGISEALVVTALGLLVAIPAVLAYNFLATRGESILLGLDQARSELVDSMENQFGEASSANGAHAARLHNRGGEPMLDGEVHVRAP